MKRRLLYPLNIQFFADQGGSDVPGTPQTPSLEDVFKSFKPEDILNHEGLKSVLDSRIGAATNTAIANARKKWEAEQNENLSEAEKLAKMTSAEREKYQFKKEREKFDSERAQFEREKLILEAAKQLASKGIDASMADFIVGKDAEETKTRMESFEKAFNAAVENVVNSKLKGNVPPTKAPDDNKAFTMEQIKAMTPAQINANWDAVMKTLGNK